MGGQRPAQIAMQHVPEIEAVLHDQRLVEPELCPHRGKLRRIDVAFAEHQQHRVAGYQMDQAEGEDGDAEECHQHDAQASGKEGSHALPAQSAMNARYSSAMSATAAA